LILDAPFPAFRFAFVFAGFHSKMSCLKRTKKNLLEFYDWFKSGDPTKCVADLRKVMQYFDRFCFKHGLEYWTEFGSLLGCYRHNDVIPIDYDGDVGTALSYLLPALLVSLLLFRLSQLGSFACLTRNDARIL
jgi:hypothetical protein